MSSDRPFPTKRGVLTREEINALLRPDLSDLDPLLDAAPQPQASTPREFSPFEDDDTDEPLAARAERVATRMTSALRRATGMSISFAAARVGEGLGADMPVGAVHLMFETPAGDPIAALSLSAELAATSLDAVCGVQSSLAGTSLARIELSDLARQLLIAGFDCLSGTLSSECGCTVRLSRIETEARFSKLSVGAGGGAHVILRADSGGQTHGAKLSLVRLSGPEAVETSAPTREFSERQPPHLAHAGLPIGLETRLTARIARLTVPSRKVARFKVGQTILLGVPADQPVDLLSGPPGSETARPVARGAVGRQGRRMAVKLTRILR